jgi:transcriptional regulator with XRE-family HTH domain
VKITTKIKDSYTLGQIIQQGRMEQGFSQRELARKLGVSQKWIWEMEQGKPGILMDRLFNILDINNINLFAEFEITIEDINE